MQDEAGTALGQASLTVEEQATTIATLADHGQYSTPHVIQQITDGSQVIPARIVHRQVLTPDQAADVDWAMSFDTQPGGTAAGLGLDNGQTVIAKTGTTNLSQSAFFMGATPKYAMAVGMFVSKPTCPPRLQAQCSSRRRPWRSQPPAGIQIAVRGRRPVRLRRAVPGAHLARLLQRQVRQPAGHRCSPR